MVSEVRVNPVARFLDNPVFYPGVLTGHREKLLGVVTDCLNKVAALDNKLVSINKLLARYQGKLDGKIMIQFIDKEVSSRPILVVYKRYERKLTSKDFSVRRVQSTGRSPSSQRNTVNLSGKKLANDKTVKLLIDAAAGLIKIRAEEMKKLDSISRSLSYSPDRFAKEISDADAAIELAKSLAEEDFSDLAAAYESIEKKKDAELREAATKDGLRIIQAHRVDGD